MSEYFEIPGMPSIPGLRTRGLDAPDDYSNMRNIVLACSIEDDFEYSDTVEDISKSYQHLANCDITKDILFVEVDNKAIGYSRVSFIERTDEPGYIYNGSSKRFSLRYAQKGS